MELNVKAKGWKGYIIPSKEEQADLERRRQAFSMNSPTPDNTTRESPTPSQQLVISSSDPTTKYNPMMAKPQSSPPKSANGTPRRKKAAITIKGNDVPQWRRNPTRKTSHQTYDSERDIGNDVHNLLTKAIKATPTEQKGLEAKITKRLFHLTQDLPEQDDTRLNIRQMPVGAYSTGEGSLVAMFIPKPVEDDARAVNANLDEAQLSVPIFAKRFSYLEVDMENLRGEIEVEQVNGEVEEIGDSDEPRKKRVKT